MAMEKLIVDSPLWMAVVSDDEPFANLVVPDNLAELVKQVVIDSEEELKERLKPYNTKPTWRTWVTLLD